MKSAFERLMTMHAESLKEKGIATENDLANLLDYFARKRNKRNDLNYSGLQTVYIVKGK